jgi:hypothetical protein
MENSGSIPLAEKTCFPQFRYSHFLISSGRIHTGLLLLWAGGTNQRGPSLVSSSGSPCWYIDFHPVLAALVSLTSHFLTLCVPIAQQTLACMQSCRVACLLICVSECNNNDVERTTRAGQKALCLTRGIRSQ